MKQSDDFAVPVLLAHKNRTDPVDGRSPIGERRRDRPRQALERIAQFDAIRKEPSGDIGAVDRAERQNRMHRSSLRRS